MKKSFRFIIFFIFFISVFIAIKLSTNAQDNYSYNIYSPQNASQISKNISDTKESQIIFIVDFSNSMNEPINGKSKLEMARNTMAEILPKIPPDVKIGLRVYGYKSGFTYLQGCQASKLTVPLNRGNYRQILQSLYTTNAVGWTPITYSLKQSINHDFIGTTGKKHIILLTDGGENCDESPCTYVINLMRERNDIKIDVIAFDIKDTEANNQLRCTALVTSGKFLSAGNEADLSRSLFETVGISKDVRGDIKIQQ